MEQWRSFGQMPFLIPHKIDMDLNRKMSKVRMEAQKIDLF